MTTSPLSSTPAPDGKRKAIAAATEAAVWALSNGVCYAPRCTAPVVVEVMPGIYKKNAQVAHVYGVRPKAPRYRENIPDRDSFKYLLLLCTPHHSLVDDKKTGERDFPPETLLDWKRLHEGGNRQALAALGSIDEDDLTDLLTEVFSPPLKRLEDLATQLERTGTVTRQNLADLKQIITVMQDTAGAPDRQTALTLSQAAEILSLINLPSSATRLSQAAEILSSLSLPDVAGQLAQVSRTLPQAAQQAAQAAEMMSMYR
ncbi:hypothetical protein [Catenuloplanes atrovinosus]|uniref:HNH endonuclease n=1 Tax=Catenuloplanes atrovinosus TaxID=137266 RepID=A0AAE3YMW4_9ACTN|nr:hypothetical protein [Catenuloplanes atrovinosus]MDR7276007.1 hypothetical protein [Catenuloplanes atrovinosus]